jgi:hypothetical protein
MQLMTTVPSRRAALLRLNLIWLRQALDLVEVLDDSIYVVSRTGPHLRHILEFYGCFLDGLEFSHIDYDARRRDQSIESRRDAAVEAIRTVIRALESNNELRGERIVWVRMEDAEGSGVADAFMESSISRELQALSSHTVHHFALIAMSLRSHGFDVDPEFGVAPSTLRYQRSQAEAA